MMSVRSRLATMSVHAICAVFIAHAVVAAPQGPRFSWDTLPVFFHSANTSGNGMSPESLQVMAKFPMVTIGKVPRALRFSQRDPGVQPGESHHRCAAPSQGD